MVVFSGLAELSIGAFSDACTVDIVEEEQAAYRISCPRVVPDVAPVVSRVLGATGAVATRTVRTRILATPVTGHPHYAGIVVHTWRAHHASPADTTIARLLVERAVAVVAQERLADRPPQRNCSGGNRPPSVDDAAAILEASLASNGRIGEATGILMALHQVDAETAFAMLRAQSRRNSRTSRDVADRFVATRASVPAPRGSGGGGHTWSC